MIKTRFHELLFFSIIKKHGESIVPRFSASDFLHLCICSDSKRLWHEFRDRVPSS